MEIYRNLGKVQVVYRGNYDPTETYYILDRVNFNGNIFECRVETITDVPPVVGGNDYWIQITDVASNDGDAPEDVDFEKAYYTELGDAIDKLNEMNS